MNQTAFQSTDMVPLLARLRAFVRRGSQPYALRRLTIVPCGRGPSSGLAQVIVLGESTEARLHVGGEFRTVRLAGRVDLSRIEVGSREFNLFSFFIHKNMDSLLLEVHTSDLPSSTESDELARRLRSNFGQIKVLIRIDAGSGFPMSGPDADPWFRSDLRTSKYVWCDSTGCGDVDGHEQPR